LATSWRKTARDGPKHRYVIGTKQSAKGAIPKKPVDGVVDHEAQTETGPVR
jgi:hypothetical protein